MSIQLIPESVNNHTFPLSYSSMNFLAHVSRILTLKWLLLMNEAIFVALSGHK